MTRWPLRFGAAPLLHHIPGHYSLLGAKVVVAPKGSVLDEVCGP